MKNKKSLLMVSTLCLNVLLSPVVLAINTTDTEILDSINGINNDAQSEIVKEESVEDSSDLSEVTIEEEVDQKTTETITNQDKQLESESTENDIVENISEGNNELQKATDTSVETFSDYQPWGVKGTAFWKYDSITGILTLKGSVEQGDLRIIKNIVPDYQNIKSIKVDGILNLEGDASRLFEGLLSLESIESEKIDVSNVTDMSRMFYQNRMLTTLDVSNWNTSNVTDMNSMFYQNRMLTTLDVSNWNTSNVTDMNGMFFQTNSLINLDVSNWDTSNVTDMSFMIGGMASSELAYLDVSGWNTSSVTNMASMFSGMDSVTTLDVSNWDTSNVTSMSNMFGGLSSLTTLDVSNWNTSNVTDMYALFSNLSSLTNLDVSNWDTSNVTNMWSTFSGMNSLTILDVSNWNTNNVTNMRSTFSGMNSLTNLDISNWNTSNVTNMTEMFNGASLLTTLDVSNWDTSNVTNMTEMFKGTSSLTSLNLSNWNTSNVTKLQGMFEDANSLDTLILGTLSTFSRVFYSVKLPEKIIPPYTGRWLLEGDDSISYPSSGNFIANYDGKVPGTYYREKDTDPVVKEYKVTFESNGGSAVTTQTVEESALAVLPKEPAKTGYTFKGWYTDANLTTVYDFNTPVTKDITLYAKWEKIDGSSQIDNNKTDNGSGKTSTPLGKHLPKTGEVKSYLPTVGLILSMMLISLLWMKKRLNFKED